MIVTSVNCRSSTSSLIAVGVAGAVMARCTVSGVGKIHNNSDNILNDLRNDSPLKKEIVVYMKIEFSLHDILINCNAQNANSFKKIIVHLRLIQN